MKNIYNWSRNIILKKEVMLFITGAIFLIYGSFAPNIYFIILGVFFILCKKSISYNFVRNLMIKSLLLGLSVFLVFAIFEAVLRFEHLYKMDNPHIVWIPEKYKKMNEDINAKNRAIASRNPFGFNDKRRSVEKKKGVYRIVVLGDSFIWGDGLPYDKIWSHKLERKFETYSNTIEVMSWGKCG